jgi:hypothetical protein
MKEMKRGEEKTVELPALHLISQRDLKLIKMNLYDSLCIISANRKIIDYLSTSNLFFRDHKTGILFIDFSSEESPFKFCKLVVDERVPMHMVKIKPDDNSGVYRKVLLSDSK